MEFDSLAFEEWYTKNQRQIEWLMGDPKPSVIGQNVRLRLNRSYSFACGHLPRQLFGGLMELSFSFSGLEFDPEERSTIPYAVLTLNANLDVHGEPRSLIKKISLPVGSSSFFADLFPTHPLSDVRLFKVKQIDEESKSILIGPR